MYKVCFKGFTVVNMKKIKTYFVTVGLSGGD